MLFQSFRTYPEQPSPALPRRSCRLGARPASGSRAPCLTLLPLTAAPVLRELYGTRCSDIAALSKSFLALVSTLTAESFQPRNCSVRGKQLNEPHCPFHKTQSHRKFKTFKVNLNLFHLQESDLLYTGLKVSYLPWQFCMGFVPCSWRAGRGNAGSIQPGLQGSDAQLCFPLLVLPQGTQEWSGLSSTPLNSPACHFLPSAAWRRRKGR